jgi:hypothetical protein
MTRKPLDPRRLLAGLGIAVVLGGAVVACNQPSSTSQPSVQVPSMAPSGSPSESPTDSPTDMETESPTSS